MDPRSRGDDKRGEDGDDEEELGMTEGGMRMAKTGAGMV